MSTAKRPSLTQRLTHARVAALNQKMVHPTVCIQTPLSRNIVALKESEHGRKHSWIGTQRDKLMRTASEMSETSRTKDNVVIIGESEYTKTQVDEYKQLFSMFDTDGSGAIGNDELKQAMMSIGLHTNDQEIDNLIREVDEDGNGEIDFAEFCACMKKSQSLVKTTNEEIIRQCFDTFDQDGNGVITESEFKYVAKEIGEYDDQLAEFVFNELDISSNGYLTAEQFATVVDDYLLSSNEESGHKQQQQQNQHCDGILDDAFSSNGSTDNVS